MMSLSLHNDASVLHPSIHLLYTLQNVYTEDRSCPVFVSGSFLAVILETHPLSEGPVHVTVCNRPSFVSAC